MPPGAFRHEAMPYPGAEQFVGLAASFLERAVQRPASRRSCVVDERQAGAPPGRRSGRPAPGDVLRRAVVGRNPAHLIPAWRSFVDDHAGDRGAVGHGRAAVARAHRAAEIAECHQHEALLNLALADAATLTLLCPFDGRRSRRPRRSPRPSAATPPSAPAATPGSTPPTPRSTPATLLSEPLPAAPDDAAVFPFTDADLRELRAYVAAAAGGLGFGRDRPATSCSPSTRWRPTATATAAGAARCAPGPRTAAASSARSVTAAGSPTRWWGAAAPRRPDRRPRSVDRQPAL